MYVSEFYKKLFGHKVYKISLDAGCTCPTRDGTKGTRGCIFCSAAGSGDFAASRELSVSDQIEEAKKLVQKKLFGRSGGQIQKNTGISFSQKGDRPRPEAPVCPERGDSPRPEAPVCPQKGDRPRLEAPVCPERGDRPQGKYIAYFQNFTNTYGEPEKLSRLYREALSCPEICGISIATRPDCIDEKILSEIKPLCDITFVQIELGLQTTNEKSVDFIRRGYENSEYFEAIRKIRGTDPRIHIVTHVIFGLPGESSEDMMNTVRTVCQTADGIKISCLHILEGTDLAVLYKKGEVIPLEEEEYYSLLQKAMEIIPSDFVVHRLTGDGPKSLLLAPLWTSNKRKIHNELSRRFDIFK